jgi:hypothetical protein
MRTLTAQQEAALECTAGYGTHARVKVLRGATWHDLTALFEQRLDFLEEVSWSEAMDSPVASAQVRLRREVNGTSLAPLLTTSRANLVSGSYSPLLSEGATFTVEVAVMPLGMAPTSTDWVDAFRGRIDEVDAGEEGLAFSGRDYGGGLLQDTYIETEVEYGSTLGTAVQTVMQSILTANGLSAFTLYTPVSPSWALGRYIQKGEPVADALAVLARQLGWEWRYKWLSSGPGTGAWRLWFWSPDRAATVPVWSFAAGTYRQLGELRTSIEDVRNAIEVVYFDRADLDAAGNPKRKTVLVSDATSITAHGRRFMRVAEGATSNINTSSEATTLAGRALADLKDKPLGVALEVDLHPGLELGDLVALPANQVHFSAQQTAAVQSLTHTVNATTASTKLVLRGKPSTSTRVWLSMEQRPGIAPTSPFSGPSAPSNLAAVATASGFRLRFDPPTVGPGAAGYELHVSTTNGFTPSSSTRVDTADATEFTRNDLTPGTTYYLRVVPRDAKGNRGTASSQVTVTPRYVEPRALQPDVSVAQLPLNADFQAANVSGAQPDAWEVTAGTWSTDLQEETTTVYSGTRAVRFNATAVAARLTSGFFLLRPGDMIIAEASFYGGITAYSSGNDAGVYLMLYDASFNLIGAPVLVDSRDTGVAAWLPLGRGKITTVDVFSSARYGRVSIGKTAAAAYEVLFDSARVFISPRLENRRDPTLLNSWLNYTLNNRDGARYYKDATGHVHLEGVIQGGTVGTVAFNLPSGFRPSFTRDFAVVSAAGAGYVEVGSGGDVKIVAGSSTFTSLDGIRFRAAD